MLTNLLQQSKSFQYYDFHSSMFWLSALLVATSSQMFTLSYLSNTWYKNCWFALVFFLLNLIVFLVLASKLFYYCLLITTDKFRSLSPFWSLPWSSLQWPKRLNYQLNTATDHPHAYLCLTQLTSYTHISQDAEVPILNTKRLNHPAKRASLWHTAQESQRHFKTKKEPRCTNKKLPSYI